MFSSRPPLKPAAAALAVLAATLVACLAPAHAGDLLGPVTTASKKQPKVAKVVVSGVSVKGKRVTVAGRVSLPVNTAKQRKRTRVALTLTSSARKVERFTAKIDSKRRFKATKTTKLTGTLTVAALVKIGGKQSGKKLTKRFKGPAAEKAPGKGGSGDAAGDTTSKGVPLIGTFKFDEGVSYPDGSHSGTYFRMGSLVNGSSRSRDKTYTLLRPGVDGGLRTDTFQLRSIPLFDDSGVLSNRIVQRELFFGSYFTIFTEPNDLVQDGARPIALPQISHQDGNLTGQVTAWVANWNKNGLFNQGTPKPDGTLPGVTTPLSGTYDPATRRYTLDWTSLIVGGPFNGFPGTWHLEGTFEPAG